MVRTLARTYRLYRIDELSAPARATALNRFRHINVEHDWYAPVIDEWKARLAASAYHDTKIWFSGFGSQGDGACFEGRVALDEWLRAHAAGDDYRAVLRGLTAGQIDVRLRHSGRYVHENSVTVIAEYTGAEDAVARELDELEEAIATDARGLAREIYQALEELYDDLVSDLAVAGTVEANDFEFHSDGRLFEC